MTISKETSATSHAAAALSKPQIIPHITQSLKYTAYDCHWLPSTAKLITIGQYAKGTGALQLFEMASNELKVVKEAETKTALKCGTFGASPLVSHHLGTGDFEGNLALWDVERLTTPIFQVKGHERIINAIDGAGGYGIQCGAPELVTGSADGCVHVWDTRQPSKPVAAIRPQDSQDVRDCWSVAFGNSFNDEERCVAAGYDNGDVKLFDLRTMSLRWETNVKNGVCAIEFDRRDIKMNKMGVAGLESSYRVFDMRTYHAEKGYTSLTEKTPDATTIWCLRHVPQNRDLFVTSSGTGAINLYQYHYPSNRVAKDEKGKEYGVMGEVELLNYAVVADQPVASFSWSPDKLGLCAYTAYDQTVRVGIVTKLNKL